jgi:molybdenum cofactor cytidylyltransferase
MIERDCIMLAAGRSRRMDHWKMTLPLGKASLIEASVGAALEVCSRVVLVAGYRSGELLGLFRGQGRVEVVVNPQYEQGMFSSVRCGCREVRSRLFFLALGDMPLVQSETYRLLAAQAESVGSVPVLIPRYRGKKGHPLLLSREVGRRILAAPPEWSLREVLAEVPNLLVPVEDPHVLQDVDTPEDYRGLPAVES